MNAREIVDKVIELANLAANVIPSAALIGKGAEIGSKVIDIIDDLGEDIAPDQQAAAQAARANLALAVKAKAARVSDKLRGN